MQKQVIGKYGVRDRIKLYAEECERKKEIERREQLKVNPLNESMTDVTRFETPARKAKYFIAPSTIGKVDSPGVFQFSPEDDPIEATKMLREKKVPMNRLFRMPFDSRSKKQCIALGGYKASAYNTQQHQNTPEDKDLFEAASRIIKTS
jgi:hypothetical protein